MKRTAVAAVLATTARHFLLSSGGVDTPRVTHFLSQSIELAEGTKQSWVTVTRMGDFTDPRYGDFKITLSHLEQMLRNFEARVLGQDVFLDVSHRPDEGAAGKFLKLAIEGTKLRALIEWTEFGLDAVKKRGFAYLSAEYHENWKDNEQQKAHGCVLLGAGLTTRPVIKHLDSVQIQLSQTDDAALDVRRAISPHLLKELSEQPMNYLDQLKAKLLALGLTDSTITMLLAQAKAQIEAAADDSKKLACVAAWETLGKGIADQVKEAAAKGQAVNITLAAPDPAAAPAAAPAAQASALTPEQLNAAVARALAEHTTAAAQATATAQTAQAGKLKLLSDTIAAGDPTLTPEGVKKFAEDYSPMITAVSTDEQVKALAALAVKQAQQLTAAQKLVTLGYNAPSGQVHISVGSDNSTKALQAEIDKRLGFDTMSPARRFERTGGVLLAENKAFAEKALAHFDATHGRELDAEHKALAGGSGVIADVRVPVVAERTVLREALYGLVSLNFVNTGTAPFANVITIPFSFRDTTAAGVSGLRRYERQAIRNAGVIQTQEEARPIPQKLAMNVSSEMRMLMSASPIDFDPVAENIRNIIRVVGEDTEAINMNEMVMAADDAGVAALNDTLTSQVNGTNRVFVTTQFPIVRPRRIFDLAGVQQGSTINPLVVTLGGTPRNEFLPNADGSALAVGTYYIMDYNLGELRFVSETGTSVIPANTTPLTVVGSFSTNASRFDTDLGALTVGARYDQLLTAIGSRKVVIENDRYYTANMILCSGAVDNAISQATSFTANASRTATGLSTDGSVGQVKNIPLFNSRAPGLMLGDTRILVGERGNTRFRMVKPFSMNPIEQARNASGQFIDAQESFGTQWVVSHTPQMLKNSLTSVILFSTAGRIARA